MLEVADRCFFAYVHGPANIRIEPQAALKPADIDGLGDDFQNDGKGFVDFLLLDSGCFSLIVLEAKPEDKEPLGGK